MRSFALLLALALAGCAGEHAAPVAHGPWRPLAPGLWDINPGAVSVPAMPGE